MSVDLIQDKTYVEQSHDENFVDYDRGKIFAQLSQDNTCVEPLRKFVDQGRGENFIVLSDDEMFVEQGHEENCVEYGPGEKLLQLSHCEMFLWS